MSSEVVDKVEDIELVEIAKNECGEKNGVLYASWASVWGKFITSAQNKNYTFKIREKILDDGSFVEYFGNEEIGYSVYVDIYKHDKLWFTERLAIMDFKNKPQFLKKNPFTIFDINNTIQRCITKGLARIGIGLNVYNGDFSHVPSRDNVVETMSPTFYATQLVKSACESIKECGGLDHLKNYFETAIQSLRSYKDKIEDEVYHNLLLKLSEAKDDKKEEIVNAEEDQS